MSETRYGDFEYHRRIELKLSSTLPTSIKPGIWHNCGERTAILSQSVKKKTVIKAE